jgi:hypothetical protein
MPAVTASLIRSGYSSPSLVVARVRGVEHEASSKKGNWWVLRLDEIRASNAKTPRGFYGIVNTSVYGM